MITTGLIAIPMVLGLIAYFMSRRQARRALLVVGAMVHAALTVALVMHQPAPEPGAWIGVDSLGIVFLSIASGLFLATSVFAIGYLRAESTASHVDREEGFLFRNEREGVFIACLFFFLAAMSLVTLSQHLGLLWIGVEATTLASAPLIYFHRHHRSLEATWKYLLICSVGVALALLGNFVLSMSAQEATGSTSGLVLGNLLGNAAGIDPVWLKAAFLLFLVGYGTKMGLVPLHTWLPDAHSEAPSMVSALLSGCLLNCAFLGILRPHQILVAADASQFSGSLLVVFGVLSLGGAATFILGQADFKRMLAYSSVEHMGILALGVGLGGAGVYGALLHAFNHSLTKGCLFLAAGNILAVYRTKTVAEVSGVLRVLPVTGVLWLGGFFAITGVPPFGTFLSEFQILKAALDGGRWLVSALYLVFLSLIFIGMSGAFLSMTQGTAASDRALAPGRPAPAWTSIPPALLLAAVLGLGIHVPGWMNDMLTRASDTISRPAAAHHDGDVLPADTSGHKGVR